MIVEAQLTYPGCHVVRSGVGGSRTTIRKLILFPLHPYISSNIWLDLLEVAVRSDATCIIRMIGIEEVLSGAGFFFRFSGAG